MTEAFLHRIGFLFFLVSVQVFRNIATLDLFIGDRTLFRCVSSCVFVNVFLCLCPCVCVLVSVSLCLCPCVCVLVSVSLCLCPCVCVLVFVSLCLCIFVFLSSCIFVFSCLCVFLFFYFILQSHDSNLLYMPW